jgi:predicted nucleic acid-binding Zn ribbon protein
MNPLSQVLEQALRRLDGDAGLEARAVMLWPEIVGPQLSRVSEVRGVQNGTLVVLTRSSAWNQELSFQKAAILRRYRERLGKEVIHDLRCVVGAVRGRAAPSAAAEPPEEEIRRIRLPAAEIERIRTAAENPDPELAQAIRRTLTREAQLRHWHLEHGARSCARCGAIHRTSRDLCPACRQDDATARETL